MRDSKGRFVKGHTYNLGKKMSDEARKNISKSAKKRPMLVAGWNKGIKGNESHSWNGGSRTYYHYKYVEIMENHIWRKLNKGEVVHHIDFNPENNDINNLKLMTDSEHSKYHYEVRSKDNFKKR